MAAIKFSPTQVNKYSACPRKWGWEYLEKLRPPQGKAAAFGESCHEALEDWLRKGVPPAANTPEGKVVWPALEFLPKPHPSLEIERWIGFTWDGFHFHGKVDLGYWAKRAGGRIWVVHDHKTTSDLMWALTEEQLPHDPQAIIYAKEAIDRHEVDEVLLSWMYMRTRGKALVEPRRVVLRREDIDSGMEIIRPYVAEMTEHRHKHLPVIQERGTKHEPGQDSPVLSMDHNAYECSAYGGCPFVDRCKLTRRERMRSIMAKQNKKISLKEKMAARKAGGSKAGKTAKLVPVVNPPEQPTDEETQEEAAQMEASRGRNRKKTSRKALSTEPAAIEADTSDDSTEEDDDKPRRGRGRPKGSTSKSSSDAQSHEASFVQIYVAAIAAGGEERHISAAAKAWAVYKTEFGV